MYETLKTTHDVKWRRYSHIIKISLHQVLQSPSKYCLFTNDCVASPALPPGFSPVVKIGRRMKLSIQKLQMGHLR